MSATQGYFCPGRTLDTSSAGAWAADKVPAGSRAVYLCAGRPVKYAAWQTDAHIVPVCGTVSEQGSLKHMCRTREHWWFGALQAMTGQFSYFHALVKSQDQQAGARLTLKQDIGLVMAVWGPAVWHITDLLSSNGSLSEFHTHNSVR